MRSQFEYEAPIRVEASPQDARLDDNPFLQSVKEPAIIEGGQTYHRRHRPSEALWRFILSGVDAFLVISLFVWVYFTFLGSTHLKDQPASGFFSLWREECIFLCLAFACWIFAAQITHAQDLNYASNRFRSLLCAFLALLLLILLLIAVINPLVGVGFANSLAMALIFLGAGLPLLFAWRLLFAWMLNLPRFRRKAVIVGAEIAGVELAQEMTLLKYSTIDIMGYIQEEPDASIPAHSLPILGNRYTLRLLAQNHVIDMIVLAVDYRTSMELFQEAIDARQFGIAVVPGTVILESISGKVPVKNINDQWYSLLPLSPPSTLFYALWEKCLNFAFGACGFFLLLLVLPVVTILTCIESPGPIFYAQERLGFQGKTLRLYKFRSMRPNAESTGNAVWATANDPRVTRFGRFMRRTHLDELPQVINILRGEMSLIGPRPERAEFVSELEKTIPFYRCRLAIKPGLTGWAQVKYRYGNTSDDALVKLQYDLYYAKHRSFMLDMFIILKTVLEVLRGRGM